MKRWLIIGLFVLLALAACVKDPEPVEGPTRKETFSSELSAIDSLMWQRPDSALACLLPYFDTCCAAEHDRHYAHLLLSELLYKNDYAQTNRAELQDAVVYFDSLAQNDNAHTRRSHCGLDPQSPSQKDILAFLAARAHYIYGVGYYEQDSAVPACREYLKALEIMEERFAEKELVGMKAQFMAISYSHLTSLFSDYYMHDQAIYFGKVALDYYDKYEVSPRYKAWILNEIGSQFEMMENYDSACFYYSYSLTVLEDTNNITYRDLATRMAYLSYKTNREVNAPLKQLKQLLQLSESIKEAMSRSAIIGGIYYHEQQYDSAWLYLDLVFQNSPSIDSKKQAAEWLVEICQIQGKDSEILKYAEFLVPYATQDENQSHVKSQLTKLHQNYVHDKIELRHKRQTRNLMKVVGMTLSAILLLALVSAAFHFINKKRFRYLKKQREETERQLETERHSHKMKQAALAGRLKRSNEALREHKEEKENIQKVLEAYQKQTNWSGLDFFLDEDICQEILDALHDKTIKREAKTGDYSEIGLTEMQLCRLNAAVENHFTGFSKMLTDLNRRISKAEIQQCQLYLLNLEDVQIAHLLSCDYSTVKKRSKKMKIAFNTEKEFGQFIREFVL